MTKGEESCLLVSAIDEYGRREDAEEVNDESEVDAEELYRTGDEGRLRELMVELRAKRRGIREYRPPVPLEMLFIPLKLPMPLSIPPPVPIVPAAVSSNELVRLNKGLVGVDSILSSRSIEGLRLRRKDE
uniref:Uncharacterized protein n=1 Tax=Tetranychus urticae TaxID=32264 RepID=T1L276_TETUR